MTDLGKSSGTLRRVYGALLLVPVVALVWFDQMAAGVILACLGCLMGLEIKRITGLPLVAGLFVLALISVQSFPHWMLGLAFTMNVGLALMGFGLVAAIIVGIFSSRLAGLFVGLLCLCLASGGLLVSQPSTLIPQLETPTRNHEPRTPNPPTLSLYDPFHYHPHANPRPYTLNPKPSTLPP